MDDFIDQMKESAKKNSEHTEVMQKMTIQREQETVSSKQAHKDLMIQYGKEATQNREQFKEMLEEQKEERKVARENMEKIEKRHQEQLNQSAKHHKEEKKQWEDNFNQMISMLKREHVAEPKDDEETAKKHRGGRTPQRVDQLKKDRANTTQEVEMPDATPANQDEGQQERPQSPATIDRGSLRPNTTTKSPWHNTIGGNSPAAASNSDKPRATPGGAIPREEAPVSVSSAKS
jgi:hypothetical protein